MARQDGPQRAAIRRAAALHDAGDTGGALERISQARRAAPPDGKGLASDEAFALAEGWAFQAVQDRKEGRREAALEDLAIAEQILDGRPEHNAMRGRACAEIAAQLTGCAAGLEAIRDEYLETAQELLGRPAATAPPALVRRCRGRGRAAG